MKKKPTTEDNIRFEEMLKEAIVKILRWDNLNIFEKIMRKYEKPSEIDYKIFAIWTRRFLGD